MDDKPYLRSVGQLLSRTHARAFLGLVRNKEGGFTAASLCETQRFTGGIPDGATYSMCKQLEDCGLLTSRWQVGGGKRERLYAVVKNGRWHALWRFIDSSES